MKQIIRRATLKIALFCTLFVILAPGIWPQDQNGTTASKYNVTELPMLGGTVGAADSINDRGLIAGTVDFPGDRIEHAVMWMNGVITDLGTFPGGPNSAIGFPSKNNQGILVGFAQTDESDPLHEQWEYVCGAFENKPICTGKDLISFGFVLQNGQMRPLPTLGGSKGQAFGINNLGQIVGFAETSNLDATCVRPQQLDYLGVIWGTDGTIQAQLPPYPGDLISAAVAINDLGQAVGGSGPCATLSPSIGAHALLWQNGMPHWLGTLGGTTNNVAFAINRHTQIVGSSGLLNNTGAHAFIWENDVMTDLGILQQSDVFSIAYSLNDNGQVVGESCDAKGSCRAFLWQNGVMFDLNSLVPPGSPKLVIAYDINNQGQIVGEAYDQTTGNSPAYLATPN